MKHVIVACLAISCGTATAAFAQSADSKAPVKLSASECTNLWQQAGGSSSKGLSQSQSAAYVKDFKAANPDGDTTIDQNEWLAACNKGLIHNSSSSGASSGSSGSDSSKPNPAEHAPTNRMDDQVPQMTPPAKQQ